ncbi:uncharacterized protein LOC119272653 [Triticum dicoccoides]|uniref:uncharacterized protein LOC119272653 n=1 Tax=Triticum dicoccoides TaxID=85692 RepID=UPI00188EBE22|nr:uncharacterized protein LOC119272653 [Triticum dicoccoides]
MEVSAAGNAVLARSWQTFTRAHGLGRRCALHFKYGGDATLFRRPTRSQPPSPLAEPPHPQTRCREPPVPIAQASSFLHPAQELVPELSCVHARLPRFWIPPTPCNTSSLTWCPCALGSSSTPASPASSRRRASRQAKPPERRTLPHLVADRNRASSVVPALHSAVASPATRERCLLCFDAGERRPRSCAPAAPAGLCRSAVPRPSSRLALLLPPQITVAQAPFGPRAAGELHQAPGSALPSLLFAGAPVPRIRRGAVVLSSSRILALSVQLRRCLPSTPLLDPLLQDRDDERCRRALTRAWVASNMPRPSAPLLQPPFQSGQGPWFR